jgi:hypothetical protein
MHGARVCQLICVAANKNTHYGGNGAPLAIVGGEYGVSYPYQQQGATP